MFPLALQDMDYLYNPACMDQYTIPPHMDQRTVLPGMDHGTVQIRTERRIRTHLVTSEFHL
jgi:hypothetical protein